jgi:hypothetical protein
MSLGTVSSSPDWMQQNISLPVGSYTLLSSVPNVPYVIMDQSVKIYCGINQDFDCHSPRDR